MKLCTFLLPPELRPRWCEIAERILAENAILQFANQIGSNFLINPFTQGWRVNMNSDALPDSLERMMKTAEKYGATFVPLKITQVVRKRMPYWFHWVNKPQLVSQYYDKWGRCQQLNHGIKYVGQMLEHATKGRRMNCKNRITCKCLACYRDRQEGCENPAQCRRNAGLKLDNITPEWDPRKHEDDPEDTDGNEPEPPGGEYTRAWNPHSATPSWPIQLVRIFTTPDTQNSRRRAAGATRRGDVELYTDGSCLDNGTDDARCGSGIWYGPDDPRNRALRVVLPAQSNNVGELVAVLVA
ncbi:hypothetical protein DFP72DRAFT_798205, partial [Ephemerocybe angulata]